MNMRSLSSHTKAELIDLYDEYFTTVINIEADAQSLGYSCYNEQIDDLIWILVFEKTAELSDINMPADQLT